MPRPSELDNPIARIALEAVGPDVPALELGEC